MGMVSRINTSLSNLKRELLRMFTTLADLSVTDLSRTAMIRFDFPVDSRLSTVTLSAQPIILTSPLCNILEF